MAKKSTGGKKKKKLVDALVDAPVVEYIRPDLIAQRLDKDRVMELTSCLPVIAKVAKLIAKGRSEDYVCQRFGITRKTLKMWVITRTFIINFRNARKKVLAAREAKLKKHASSAKIAMIELDDSDELLPLRKLIKIPDTLKDHQIGDRYTPEEREAVMMLMAMYGSVKRVHQITGIPSGQLRAWRRSLRVDDEPTYRKLREMFQQEFLEEMMEQAQLTMVKYFQQLRKKHTVSNSDARAAVVVIEKIFEAFIKAHGTHMESRRIADASTAVVGSDVTRQLVNELSAADDAEHRKKLVDAIQHRMQSISPSQQIPLGG